MQVQPYLFFNGRAEEAAAFYKQALGAEVTGMMRYRESPESAAQMPGLPPGSEDKVMHMAMKVAATEVLASDGMCSGKPDFHGFSLALTAPDKAKGEQWMAALGAGGKVDMPFGPTFFSPGFGMVTDQFGLSWMIVLDAEPAPAA